MTASQTAGREALTNRIDLAVGLLLTAVLVAFHGTFLFNAGALWRDEAQIFNISTASTFAEQWSLNEYDSFPILWQLALRGWQALGLTETDFSLRVLGFLVGLAIVGMLWVVTRQFGVRTPLIPLALFAINPIVLIYGDSIRGYGFGMLWLLFMVARLWRMVHHPTRPNAAWAALSVLLAVHSSYFNVVLFAALGAAGLAVFLLRREWKPAGLLLGIGFLAALTMLPYLEILGRQQQWVSLFSANVTPGWLWEKFSETLNTSGAVATWIWLGLVVLALGTCLVRWIRSGSSIPDKQTSRDVFVAGMFCGGPILYLGFLLWRNTPTQIWYYIGLMAFMAVAIECGLAGLLQKSIVARLARQAFAAAMFIAVFATTWAAVHTRMTNVDVIAKRLAVDAVDGDFILVNPWWPGVTFARYYKGNAEWSTLPDLGPIPVQRFDLFREKLFQAEPIKPVLDKITAALRNGHRVWIVGNLIFLRSGEDAGSVPPAPEGPIAEEPYLTIWSRQAGQLIQSHATKASPVAIPAGGPVSPFEDLNLIVVEGWR